MANTFTATVEAHDDQARVSWLNWQGLNFCVPLATEFQPGSAVAWTIPSDQVRLLSRGSRQARISDTPFSARITGLHRQGSDTVATLVALRHPENPITMTIPASVAERNGLHVGEQLVLRLRGESIQLSPVTAAAPPASTLLPTRLLQALLAGVAIGAAGGLIGLGGAEFRLPLLIGLFGFAALSAVILNKAMSLIVVASALLFRSAVVPVAVVLEQWPVIVNLLAGSLLGAWLGAGWATRLKGPTLYRVIAALLVGIAAVLLVGHGHSGGEALFTGWLQVVVGVGAGFGIGVVASVLGVAGGELLIPTLVILFAADIKLAGSLSLAVSLPTMVVGFMRYSQDKSFDILKKNKDFVWTMAAGSIAGAWLGGMLLGVVPTHVLLPALALVLLWSSVKVWRHR